MNKRLNILVLTQALEDLLAKKLGGYLEEEDLWSAETYVSAYPTLHRRLQEKKNLKGWLREVRVAKEELAERRQA